MDIENKPYHKLYKQYEKCDPLLARDILLSKEYQKEKELKSEA